MEPFRPPPLPPAPANPFSAPPPPPLHQQAESAPPPPHQQAGSAPPPATLLVRHLPEAITQEMLSRLFSHYGATAVRPCTGKLRNCAFVDFRDEMAANQAQSLLNRAGFGRLRFLGKVLVVERANQPNSKNANEKHQEQLAQGMPQVPSMNSQNQKNSTSTSEPIASRLGVDYPFPPHLEYAYPPPDGNILTNIVNSLIAVPRFYTQVLHLMNKMNLPAPFRMALPTPPLPSEVPAPPPPPPQPSTAEKLHLADLSSDESEMESSDEDVDRKIKRAKHEAIVGPAVDKSIAHEAVGVKPAALVSNELQVIKKKNPVMQIKITPRPASKELADQRTIDKELASRDEQLEQKHFATPQEIEKEKLPTEEILSLPMFKNYTPGNPASVLYIKNLAKDVVHDDFYYVFGSVFESMDAARSGLIIKLMQEGRMRGQAFVTFPSVELAQHALSLAHGYAFKGKPMIIQFGRNPAASKAS
ncbi:U11/U12 small nuclear ribonucleoprotein 65 kDa protein-like isoform X1 [Lolium rigidum]|uniref:U11/U12 small nuclear ribonucleoprotein 65 kDa protein-like isoform X1 n=1 Tax=Lolium rigidum TaxID=89674 RepID=UPI001F5DE2BD|nr:U11/U12 small nuclear ribonucleoprotein 65 kDa protein-like isoform X1 [Lolium rigidum]